VLLALEVLRIRPVVGRYFTDEDERAGRTAVAVVSYDFWQTAFGGDPDVTGRMVARRMPLASSRRTATDRP
jgi:hypothetical protein